MLELDKELRLEGSRHRSGIARFLTHASALRILVSVATKVGVPVLVLERDGELRLEGAAIAMWANAFRALDALGVAGSLREAHPLLER